MSRFGFRARASFVALCLAVFAFTAPAAFAQTADYSIFASFTDSSAGGAEPLGNLVQAPDGNFYGESSYITNDIGTIDGVVYRVSPTGALSALYSPQSTAFGSGSLIVGSDGYFYGLMGSGGANGYGNIFKISPSGVLTSLYNFKDQTDGGYPTGQLVQGSDGNYYGVASQGGYAQGCVSFVTGEPAGCGTIFKLTPSGTYSVLYTFMDTTADYAGPVYGLLQGLDGNYYGVTAETVFQVTPAGKLTTLGVSDGTSDGIYFNGPLVEGSDGAFYGTAQYNGANAYGTVFKATLTGGISVVDALCGGNCPEGANPVTPLFQAGDGNFYGTTFYGNSSGPCETFGCGGVFQVTTGGKLTALYSGNDSNDGGIEFGVTPVQGSDGAIYGGAGHGGTGANLDECGGDNCGIIYKAVVSPAIPPSVVLTASATTVGPNTGVTLSYKVNAANSLTQQQCYAFVQDGASGAGSWTGKKTGTYSSSTHAFTGSATVTPTADGTYTYALTCGGNVSGFATLTVAAAKASSTTALAVSPNPDTVGVPITFKATVTGSSGTPTGDVTFTADGATLATVALASGSASFTVPSYGLPDGSYPVTATYAGSSTYNTSSKSVTVVVNSAATSTTLTATPNPLTPPAALTFTATVKRSASGATGTPTGSVGFYLGSSLLDTATLSNGVATYKLPSTSGFPAGTYTVTAKYEGDSTDLTSSGSYPVTVK